MFGVLGHTKTKQKSLTMIVKSKVTMINMTIATIIMKMMTNTVTTII